jgi:integrase
MGQVAEYLRQDLGIEAISLDQVSVRLRRNLQPINLISQKDVEQILAHLIAKNQEAGGKKQETEARLAHNAFLATLLAYFFGLRRIEMCNLRLGDMLLDAQVPYLRIWFSKRGRSRVVWARYVPPEVLDFLRAEWQRRWEAADSDPAAFFLDYGDDRRALAEMLSKMFNAAIRTLGLEGVGDALPVTLHTLRHACATRQLLMKAQVIEISRSLGHADTDTTTGSYIHAFDYLQRERLNETLAAQQQDGLTATEIGALLGIKRTAVLAELKKLPAADQEGWQRDDRHMYSWSTVVQLLASRLRMSGQR